MTKVNVTLLLAFLLTLSACNTSSNQESGSLVLFPVRTQGTPAGNGFLEFTIYWGIENTSSQPISPGADLGDTNLSTKEGHTYHFRDIYNKTFHLDLFVDCKWIPPFIRVSDVTPLKFQIGETLHPTELVFSKYGTVSLSNLSSVTYPTDKSDSAFQNLPYTFEISNEQNATIYSDIRVDSKPRIGIDVKYENLNPANGNSITISSIIYDQAGHCHSLQSNNTLKAGPGRTTEQTIWGDIDSSDEVAAEILKDAKLFVIIYHNESENYPWVTFNVPYP